MTTYPVAGGPLDIVPQWIALIPQREDNLMSLLHCSPKDADAQVWVWEGESQEAVVQLRPLNRVSGDSVRTVVEF